MTTRTEATERLPLTEQTPLQLAYEEFFEAEKELEMEDYHLMIARARVAEAKKRQVEARVVLIAEQVKEAIAEQVKEAK